VEKNVLDISDHPSLCNSPHSIDVTGSKIPDIAHKTPKRDWNIAEIHARIRLIIPFSAIPNIDIVNWHDSRVIHAISHIQDFLYDIYRQFAHWSSCIPWIAIRDR
jgi:hypothetical protein